MYYRNAQSALVVYDVTKPSSLIKAKHWVAELQRQASPGIVIALVGNKLDLCEDGDGFGDGDEVGRSGGDGDDDAPREVEDEDDDDDNDAAVIKKVSTAEARAYADEESLLFFETSAKTGHNVAEVFTAIANTIPETSLKGRSGAAGGAAGTGAGAGTQAVLNGAQDGNRVNLNSKANNNGGAKEGCAC